MKFTVMMEEFKLNFLVLIVSDVYTIKESNCCFINSVRTL